MARFLSHLHRFLTRQSFYPIALSTLLALGTYLVRVVVSNSWVVYANLIWNLVLAWVPYVFSILSIGLHQLFPRAWALLIVPGAIWLLFFPNAPYLVTDFLHLTPRPGTPFWLDILMLAIFSWTGIFLAIASLRNMQILVKGFLGGIASWIFAALSLGLGGLGIYLGRFERWNSWDLLFNPKPVLKDIAARFFDPFDNLRFFGFTILLFAFLVVCYLMFVSMRHLEE